MNTINTFKNNIKFWSKLSDDDKKEYTHLMTNYEKTDNKDLYEKHLNQLTKLASENLGDKSLKSIHEQLRNITSSENLENLASATQNIIQTPLSEYDEEYMKYGELYDLVDEDLKENGLDSRYRHLLDDLINKNFADKDYVRVPETLNSIKEVDKTKAYDEFFSEEIEKDFQIDKDLEKTSSITKTKTKEKDLTEEY